MNRDTVISRDAAGIILDVSPQYIGDLISMKRLPEVITIGAVMDYEENYPTRKAEEGDLLWHLHAKEHEAEELRSRGFKVIDPRVKQRERAARRKERAREELRQVGWEKK